MIKKLILIGAVSLSLVGCSEPTRTIVEVHEVTQIENGNVHGENINGKGEGIFYPIKDLKDAGVNDIHVGDKIKFEWTEDNFEKEIWEEFTAEKVE